MAPRRERCPLLFKMMPLLCSLGSVLPGGCGQEQTKTQEPLFVKVEAVRFRDYTPKLTLTGEISARVQSELSFRVSGRVIERKMDVGAHVNADEVVARIDPKEQQADVEAAVATVEAAEAKLHQTTSTFQRQEALLRDGYTTRRSYDQAEQDYRSAQASLDGAKAQLATARDQLAQTVLRAPSAGIITARNADVGQVLQAAQAVFTFAQDGPRDAVVNVQENLPTKGVIGFHVEVALAADPKINTGGVVREVAPSVDTATATVKVKIGIDQIPPEMLLGSAVTVTARPRSWKLPVLPWSALAYDRGKPAVWVVEPQSHKVSLRYVAIESFEDSDVVISGGLASGDLAVTAGGQLLHPDQQVAFAGEIKQ